MEKKYELIAPCHFGLEAVLKREIQDLGYEISQVEDGKVTFFGDEEAIARANIFLRTTERVLLKVGKIKAETFDELFENDLYFDIFSIYLYERCQLFKKKIGCQILTSYPFPTS